MNNDDYVIGIDIGGTNFRIGMVDDSGNVYSFVKKSSSVLVQGDPIECLYTQIKLYIDEYAKGKCIRALSMGFPSIVSKDKKILYSTPNLKGFDNLKVVELLEAKIKIPVFIDRDVNYLLKNDIRKNSLDKNATILGFYVGTGIGNAIYINGRFYSGKNGVAGELGHIPMYGITEVCGCGNVGCSETLCGGKVLQKYHDTYFKEESIDEIFILHKNHYKIKEFLGSLAMTIATEINILDPDYVILAGGVISMNNFPKEELKKEILLHCRKPFPASGLEIIFVEHTQQSGVIGGALSAFELLQSELIQKSCI